jgi:hypothetical protein
MVVIKGRSKHKEYTRASRKAHKRKHDERVKDLPISEEEEKGVMSRQELKAESESTSKKRKRGRESENGEPDTGIDGAVEGSKDEKGKKRDTKKQKKDNAATTATMTQSEETGEVQVNDKLARDNVEMKKMKMNKKKKKRKRQMTEREPEPRGREVMGVDTKADGTGQQEEEDEKVNGENGKKRKKDKVGGEDKGGAGVVIEDEGRKGRSMRFIVFVGKLPSFSQDTIL